MHYEYVDRKHTVLCMWNAENMWSVQHKPLKSQEEDFKSTHLTLKSYIYTDFDSRLFAHEPQKMISASC